MNWPIVLVVLIGVLIVFVWAQFVSWITSFINNDFIALATMTALVVLPLALILGATIK